MKRFFNKLNTVVILTVIIILSALSGIAVEAVNSPGVNNAGAETELETEESELAQALASTKLDYAAHVSCIGWQRDVEDGQLAGTIGECLSIEALKINLENSLGINAGDVEYTLHCQDIGWTPVVRNGQVAGTTGENLEAQAVCINVTGKVAESYDIYYRVHSANYGWLDWTSNGSIAGTTGLDTRAEAIEIELVKKGQPAPGPTENPYVCPEILAEKGVVSYYTLSDNGGWQTAVTNGQDSGSVGQGIALRGFAVNTMNKEPNSWIEYKGYFSNVGWVDQVFKDGDQAFAGGEQLESICIALKGLDDYSYDLYYQVHVSNIGWLGWASDGQIAGTKGGGLPIEAIRIMIVPKDSDPPQPYGDAYQEIIPPERWQWPLNGYGPDCISSGFGPREGSHHDGVDIIAPGGTPIQACKSGTVIVAGWYYGYGQCVVVVNDTGEKVYYAHMSAIGTSVGARVGQGQTIGFVGSTGNATCNHLHLGVVIGGDFVDPLSVF